MLSTIPPERRQVIGQLLRFLIGGGVVTLIGVSVYALVALVLGWHPQLGNFLAYVVAMAVGYFTHSRWSFRDHGGERGHHTALKFAVVSFISFGLNYLWVWLCTGPLGLGPAWPILPMVTITPAVTFTLNRQWVFG
jgi:putative flippase GtrA